MNEKLDLDSIEFALAGKGERFLSRATAYALIARIRELESASQLGSDGAEFDAPYAYEITYGNHDCELVYASWLERYATAEEKEVLSRRPLYVRATEIPGAAR